MVGKCAEDAAIEYTAPKYLISATVDAKVGGPECFGRTGREDDAVVLGLTGRGFAAGAAAAKLRVAWKANANGDEFVRCKRERARVNIGKFKRNAVLPIAWYCNANTILQ